MAENGKICYLCKSSVENELLFGRFYSKYKLTVHYYCLLLSSNLVQRGSNDTVGIFGFLESDIRKENERTKKCRCYICKRMHANVSCCSKKCLRTFHTVCGITNGCLSHYTDTYQSWCAAHVPLEPDSDPHSPKEACSICYDEMGQYDLITSVKAPCCRNGWFHQRCLARYAESAGYFFKCPLCKNEDKFVAEVPLRGVFVPERDAAWELEPNAFQEQLLRPTACDAEDCKCQEGRTVDNRQWPLVICGSCGSTCRHRACMEQTAEGSSVYLCQLCRPIVGEQLSLLEKIAESSGDSSDDDTASTSTSVSLARTLRDKRTAKGAGSGESGVHCSSSDEPLANIRRLAHSSARRVSDASNDSDRSDGSSIQIRRFIRQNTGKRVRRLLSDGSDDGKRSADTYSSTDTLPMRIERSPARSDPDHGSSGSPDRIGCHGRMTRQLTRRLSSLSGSSKSSATESTDSSEIVRPECSSKRRPKIVSSSDESEEKQSEDGEKAGVEASASEWDENSNMTDAAALDVGRLPPKRDKDEKMQNDAKAPEMSSASIQTRRARQPIRRTTFTERSTSESSIDRKPIKPKRTRISARSVSSAKQTEKSTNVTAAAGVTADKLDCVPQSKRRRVSRKRQSNNQPNAVKQLQEPPAISPPSTPSSLSSEASQQPVTKSRRESEPTTKSANRCSSRTPEAQNRQQQSMLQFVTVSSGQKKQPVASSDESSDLSAEETVSPFGNSNKRISSKIVRISSRRPRAALPKRRRTHSPKKESSSSPAATPAPTSSKAPVLQRTTPPKRTIVQQKDKGQKNILNYFNRC